MTATRTIRTLILLTLGAAAPFPATARVLAQEPPPPGDLESLITQTRGTLAGTDPARLPEADRALRLLAAHTRLTKAAVIVPPDLMTPPTVPAPQLVISNAGSLKGPFTYATATAELRRCQNNLDEAKNPDVERTWRTYVERWTDIVRRIESELDARIKDRGREEAFDLESIDSFAALDKFVRESKVLKSAGPEAIAGFKARAAGLSDATGLGKALANMDGTWWLAGPRFGLGEMTVTLNGGQFAATSPFNNSTFSARLSKSKVTDTEIVSGTGTWSGSRDGKAFGGDLRVDVSDDGKQVTLLLWLGKRDDSKPNTTWAVWTATKIEKK